MLTFSVQQKILGDILKNSNNLYCADCLSKSPTWASLDFGVFLCGNCAGAHRALGPTITRVRSSKLDQWNKQWVQNMKIGNSQINKYWESDQSYSLIKPKAGASLQQVNRYVVQKYIKKKYVNTSQAKHPLQAYKDGQYQIQQNNQNRQKQTQNINILNNKKTSGSLQTEVPTKQQKNVSELKKNPTKLQTKKKFQGDLLQMDHNSHQHQHQQIKATQFLNNDQDQFTQYHSAETKINENSQNVNHSNHNNEQTNIKYQDLFKTSHNSSNNNQSLNFNSNILHNLHFNHHNQVNINGHSYFNNGHNNGYHQIQYQSQNSISPSSMNLHNNSQFMIGNSYQNLNNAIGLINHNNQLHQPIYQNNSNNHFYYNSQTNHQIGTNYNQHQQNGHMSMTNSNNISHFYNMNGHKHHQQQTPVIQSNWTL